jgi:hypothetical protein
VDRSLGTPTFNGGETACLMRSNIADDFPLLHPEEALPKALSVGPLF